MICGVPEYLLYESLLYASRTSIFGEAPTKPIFGKLKIPDEAAIATIKAWQGVKCSQV